MRTTKNTQSIKPQPIEPQPGVDTAGTAGKKTTSVFSAERTITLPTVKLPKGIKTNTRLKMDGRDLLEKLPDQAFSVAFFDPQYRGILDKMGYGNEGQTRGQDRYSLEQMDNKTIKQFISSLDRVLIASGHLFLWVDKFHLCQGFKTWLDGTALDIVDMVVWNKERMGMGYRSRRMCEYLIVLQKKPRKAKGVWTIHNIPDVWLERIVGKREHTHTKPIGLQEQLILAVTNAGDIVVDPAAGSFSVMEAAINCNRNFIGSDLNG